MSAVAAFPTGAADGRFPAPLTAGDADLRDFRYMPLDVVRFSQSDLVAFEDADAIVAAILLWGAAWHGQPAGSLTNDDRALARAAGFGRAVDQWLKVRDGALRGFIECSDGRLYHPVVAEKVRDAWDSKLRQRWRTYCATLRKHNERNPENKLAIPSFEEWEEQGRPSTVARNEGVLSHEQTQSVARDEAASSQFSHAAVARENASNRREGKGREEKGLFEEGSEAEASGAIVAPLSAADFTKAVFDTGVALLTSRGRTEATARSFLGGLRKNYSDAALIDAIRHAELTEQAIEPAGFLTKYLEKNHAHARGRPSSARAFNGQLQGHSRPQFASRARNLAPNP